MTLVGVWTPAGGVDLQRLARAAGVRPEDVATVGPLAIAAVGPPARSGRLTCWFFGELHDADPAVSAGEHVVRAVAEHGVPALGALRGSYVLAVYDDAARELLLTHDHLSARALFFHGGGGRTTFGHEVGPVVAALATRPAPDPQAVPRWITDRALPDGFTLYAGVRRLGIGEGLRLSERGREVLSLWRPRYRSPARVSRDEAGAQVRQAVQRAVERRVPGESTTGILLSGGFDSGALAGTLAPLLRSRGRVLPSYSSVFPGDAWDESHWIGVLVEELGLRSTRVSTRGGALHKALAYQQHWGLPQPAPGSILDQPLLDLARGDGHAVVLDGQGGDELFMASPYLFADRVLRGRWGRAAALTRRYPGTGANLRPWQVKALLTEIAGKGGLPYRLHRALLARRASEYDEQVWLSPEARRHAEALDDPLRWKRGARGRPRWWSFLAYALTDARLLSGMQDYLRRRGELAGVSSRQPLMTDVDLVELMLALPPELAFSPDYDRALARDAMRGVVPEEVRLPISKSNYAGLMHRTLVEDELPALRGLLHRPDAEIAAHVDLRVMRAELLDRVPGFEDRSWAVWGQRVWGLATTELWLRHEALGEDFAAWAGGLRLPASSTEVLGRP